MHATLFDFACTNEMEERIAISTVLYSYVTWYLLAVVAALVTNIICLPSLGTRHTCGTLSSP
jgi:hypothetical protein